MKRSKPRRANRGPTTFTGHDTFKSMEPIDVAVQDKSICLGQFLKLANLVETGSLARELTTEGQVSMNSEVDACRGGVLRPGDIASVAGMSTRVAIVDEIDDDYFGKAVADDNSDPKKWGNL